MMVINGFTLLITAGNMDDFLNRLEKHTWLFRAGCYGMGLLSVALIFLSRGNPYLLVSATGAMAAAFYLFMLHRQSYVTGLIAKAGGVTAFLAREVSPEEWPVYRDVADLTGIRREFDAWCAQQAVPVTIGAAEQALGVIMAETYGIEREVRDDAYSLKSVITGQAQRQSVLTLLSAALFMSGGMLLFCGLAVLRPEFFNDLLTGLILLIAAMVVYWLTRYREKQLTMQMLASPVTTATLDILMSVAVAADIHDIFCDYMRAVPKPVTIGSATDWLTAEQKRRQR